MYSMPKANKVIFKISFAFILSTFTGCEFTPRTLSLDSKVNVATPQLLKMQLKEKFVSSSPSVLGNPHQRRNVAVKILVDHLIDLYKKDQVKLERKDVMEIFQELRELKDPVRGQLLEKVYGYEYYRDLDILMDEFRATARFPTFQVAAANQSKLALPEFQVYAPEIDAVLKRDKTPSSYRKSPLTWEAVLELHEKGKLALHVTCKSSVPSIKENGLDPDYGGSKGCGEMVAASLERRGGSNVDIFQYKKYQWNSVGFMYFSLSARSAAKIKRDEFDPYNTAVEIFAMDVDLDKKDLFFRDTYYPDAYKTFKLIPKQNLYLLSDKEFKDLLNIEKEKFKKYCQ